uniref:Sirohydrochlorin cobaltochelatase n=1 Tax=Desulfatirhabdium butyrativorans TaxID=340467 RepID=A0A7C4W0B5_9BACT
MVRSKRFVWTGCFILLMVMAAAHALAAHGEPTSMKKAILLTAFGTSVPEAMKAFDNIEAKARSTFPDVEIRWAFTSKMIRTKLAKQGKHLDSPEVALAKLMSEGFTHVAVLSLQTIPGEEFHELVQNARLFGQMSGGFEKILVARPLLSSAQDMETVADALLNSIPGRKPTDAIVLMGHGTEHHPSDAIYMAMNAVFQQKDVRTFVATVEGKMTIEEVIPKLRELKVKKVYLIPLMLVAGDHARNDMAGDDPDSWKSILKKHGFACEPVLKGTAEYPQVVDVWIDHLKDVMAHF